MSEAPQSRRRAGAAVPSPHTDGGSGSTCCHCSSSFHSSLTNQRPFLSTTCSKAHCRPSSDSGSTTHAATYSLPQYFSVEGSPLSFTPQTSFAQHPFCKMYKDSNHQFTCLLKSSFAHSSCCHGKALPACWHLGLGSHANNTSPSCGMVFPIPAEEPSLSVVPTLVLLFLPCNGQSVSVLLERPLLGSSCL